MRDEDGEKMRDDEGVREMARKIEGVYVYVCM